MNLLFLCLKKKLDIEWLSQNYIYHVSKDHLKTYRQGIISTLYNSSGLSQNFTWIRNHLKMLYM